MGLVEAWRLSPFIGCGIILWMLVPFSILWSVWKERNDRIFLESSCLVEDRLLLVILRMEKWTSTSNEFDSSSFDGVLHNWKATMFCRVPKSRKEMVRKVLRSPPPMGVLKFNVTVHQEEI